MSELNNLIDALPKILQYVAPGALTLWLYCFFTSHKLDNKVFLFVSCVISYIQLLLSQILCDWIFGNGFMILSEIIIIGLSLGLMVVGLYGIAYTNGGLNNFTRKHFGKDVYHSIWAITMDFKNGCSAYIYLKNKPYFIAGSVFDIEERGYDKWIALGYYGKYDIETKEPLVNDTLRHDDAHARIIVRIDDIDHIEVFNEPSSEDNKDKELSKPSIK